MGNPTITATLDDALRQKDIIAKTLSKLNGADIEITDLPEDIKECWYWLIEEQIKNEFYNPELSFLPKSKGVAYDTAKYNELIAIARRAGSEGEVEGKGEDDESQIERDFTF